MTSLGTARLLRPTARAVSNGIAIIRPLSTQAKVAEKSSSDESRKEKSITSNSFVTSMFSGNFFFRKIYSSIIRII